MNKLKKRKHWWNQEIEELYNNIGFCFIKHKESNFDTKTNTDYKAAKTKFREARDAIIEDKEQKLAQKASKLLKSVRNKFWSCIKRLKTKTQHIEATADAIKTANEETFTKPNPANESEDGKNKKEWDNIKLNSSNSFNHSIGIESIRESISSLTVGKSVGFNGINNEMIIYSRCENLLKMIKSIFEKMINNSISPRLFNISIIKPLIKDATKSSNDVQNLRPLAISDVITNLYESMLLNLLQLHYTDDEAQFGFRANSSCSHPVFILKQAIRSAIRQKKRLYVVAIDASKAFDKVVRHTLWIKLISDLKFHYGLFWH